jgi:co-chaperonin GroES (HSP10)
MTEPIVVDKRPTYDDSPLKPFTATPLGDYIVVKRIPEPEGVVILADISKELPLNCEVIGVSSKVTEIVKGDKVLVRRYSGTIVEVDKQEYTLILIQDVLLKL